MCYAENQTVRSVVSSAEEDDVPALVDETNNTGSWDEAGGSDTSPVFASAIWALHWSLRALSSGASGIQFHSESGRCGQFTTSPICTTTAIYESKGKVSVVPSTSDSSRRRASRAGHLCRSGSRSASAR